MKNLRTQFFFQIALPMLWLMFTSFYCFSQTINADGAVDQGSFDKHFQIGRTIPNTEFLIGILNWDASINVFARNTNGGAFSNMGGGGFVNITGGLRAQLVGTQIIITSTAAITATIAGYLEVQITTPGESDRFKVFNFIVRRPNDIVFLLDRSGSMGCDYNESSELDWPNCAQNPPNDPSRWARLESAVTAFVDMSVDPSFTSRVLPNFPGFTGDRMGVMYFSGTTGVPGLALTDLNTFDTNIATNMNNAETPSLATDGTSIGNGMRQAILNHFGGAATVTRRQALLLFTDGEQNTGNWIKDEPMNEGRRIETSSTDATVEMNLESADIDPIEMYSIGLVQTPAGGSTLSHIADGTGRHFNIMTATPGDFPSGLGTWAFTHFFGSAASPQVVGRASSKAVTQSGTTATFTCNDNASRVIIEIYFDKPIGQVCSLYVKKDTFDAMQFAHVNRSDYIVTAIFDLSQMPAHFSKRGQWRIQANPPYLYKNAGIDLQILAIADDHKVHIDGFLQDEDVRVGDAINPTFTINLNQAPVTDADVKAIIIHPTFDLGNLLAEAPLPNMPPPTVESNGCDGQKLSYLLLIDSAFGEKARSVFSDTIQLKHRGGGKYTAEYSGIKVSGVHKIIYWVRKEPSDFGLIERIIEQTVYVHFGEPDINLGEPRMEVTKDPPNYYFKASFRPAYKDPQGQTQYIGPGFGHVMRVEGANNFYDVDDDCNGGYELDFSDPNPNPNIKVFVDDVLIYQGPALDFDKPYRPRPTQPWSLSLHAGLTLPVSKLDSLYNPGAFVEIDLTYRINNQFDVEALLGYYGFSDGFNILGASLLAGYRIGLTPSLHLRPALGIGYFAPKNESGTVGYTGRLELVKELNTHFDISLHGAYFNLPNPKYSFLAAGLGVKYHF
ncbi:MAG: VWA domain-containing protein [Phycisphaerae bacterium]|nr:VWA domain-containing protein [Saprospiraceae bacterium]